MPRSLSINQGIRINSQDWMFPGNNQSLSSSVFSHLCSTLWWSSGGSDYDDHSMGRGRCFRGDKFGQPPLEQCVTGPNVFRLGQNQNRQVFSRFKVQLVVTTNRRVQALIRLMARCSQRRCRLKEIYIIANKIYIQNRTTEFVTYLRQTK